MTGPNNINFTVRPPDVLAIPRDIEVVCGETFVSIRQMDGRLGARWTVFNREGRGIYGPMQEAPTGAETADVLPWARSYVLEVERKRLAHLMLNRILDDYEPAPDQG